MEIKQVIHSYLNQNGYTKNSLTKERIGTLFIYPIDFTPDDCLSCDGYSLLITDYKELFAVIGTKFNQSGDEEGTFRVPDYNISGRFLQPSSESGKVIAAGLPNITGHIETRFRGQFYNGTGAFKLNTSIQDLCGNGSSSAYQKADFNASYSNSIYGNSTTVQPPSQTVHIVIKYK